MDNLSQEEIDALLEEAAQETAMEEAEGGDLGVGGGGDWGGGGIGGPDPFVDPIGPDIASSPSFDFSRPSSLSRGFERSLRSVSEGFSKDASLSFSNLMRTGCEFAFQNLRVTSFGECAAGWEHPSSIALVTMEPLQGMVLLHVEAPLMFSFFTRLLGGPPEEAVQLRDFTEVEMAMARRINERLLESFTNAGARIVELKTQLMQIENNPHYLNAIPDSEPVVELQFAVNMIPVVGFVRFVLPLTAFETVRDEFDPRDGMDLRNREDRARERRRALHLLSKAPANVSVRFRSRTIRFEELASLQVGDVLDLQHSASRPLELLVEGTPLFAVKPGQVGSTRAVQIVEDLREG